MPSSQISLESRMEESRETSCELFVAREIAKIPSAGFPTAGMAGSPDKALSTTTLQVFKGGEQVEDQHCRVSQQGRVDELNRIVWAVDT